MTERWTARPYGLTMPSTASTAPVALHSADVYSPTHHGLWTAHVGWILSPKNTATDLRMIKDFSKYPELVALGRLHFVAPLLVAAFAYWLDGWRGFVVGAGWSLVLAWHCTF